MGNLVKFKPLSDHIAVQRIAEKDKTAGGLYIPDASKEKPAEGIVIAAGPGAYNATGSLVTMALKAGDRVLFSKYGGTEVTIGGEEVLIMRECDVLGVLA